MWELNTEMFTRNAEEAARFNTISVTRASALPGWSQKHFCAPGIHRGMFALSAVAGLLLQGKALLGGFCSYFISIKKPMQPTGKRFSMKANDESMSGAQWPRTEHVSGRRRCAGQSQLLPYGTPWKFAIAAKNYPSDVISILHLVILRSHSCQL